MRGSYKRGMMRNDEGFEGVGSSICSCSWSVFFCDSVLVVLLVFLSWFYCFLFRRYLFGGFLLVVDCFVCLLLVFVSCVFASEVVTIWRFSLKTHEVISQDTTSLRFAEGVKAF